MVDKYVILEKLLFYSVISSYCFKWELDKTKKTRTVLVREGNTIAVENYQ